MLFKLPVALAMALLTLGASASERFTVTSLRRRDQPGDYPQNRGTVTQPADGAQLKVNEEFQVEYKPISSGELMRTAAIHIELEIPSLKYTHRLAKGLAPPGGNKAILQKFAVVHPRASHVKKGSIIPGTVNFYEFQQGTKSFGNGSYFPVKSVQATFHF